MERRMFSSNDTYEYSYATICGATLLYMMTTTTVSSTRAAAVEPTWVQGHERGPYQLKRGLAHNHDIDEKEDCRKRRKEKHSTATKYGDSDWWDCQNSWATLLCRQEATGDTTKGSSPTAMKSKTYSRRMGSSGWNYWTTSVQLEKHAADVIVSANRLIDQIIALKKWIGESWHSSLAPDAL